MRLDNKAATLSDWSSQPQAGGRQRMATYSGLDMRLRGLIDVKSILISGLVHLCHAALLCLLFMSELSLASQARGQSRYSYSFSSDLDQITDTDSSLQVVEEEEEEEDQPTRRFTRSQTLSLSS